MPATKFMKGGRVGEQGIAETRVLLFVKGSLSACEPHGSIPASWADRVSETRKRRHATLHLTRVAR